jgi:hypothetical protein
VTALGHQQRAGDTLARRGGPAGCPPLTSSAEFAVNMSLSPLRPGCDILRDPGIGPDDPQQMGHLLRWGLPLAAIRGGAVLVPGP